MATVRKMKPTIYISFAVLFLLLVVGAILLLFPQWGFSKTVSQEEAALRMRIVDTALQWRGASQFDGTHQQIIDIYNAHTPLAQNYTVKYSDKWCATFVSTVAIQNKLTDLIPTECGCQRQIALFFELGCWEENDDYVPLPGDIVFYSSQGSSCEENSGWSDHVGIVCGTWGNYMKVIEGNVAGIAAIRYLPIGDPSIRGYGLPDYASVIE